MILIALQVLVIVEPFYSRFVQHRQETTYQAYPYLLGTIGLYVVFGCLLAVGLSHQTKEKSPVLLLTLLGVNALIIVLHLVGWMPLSLLSVPLIGLMVGLLVQGRKVQQND